MERNLRRIRDDDPGLFKSRLRLPRFALPASSFTMRRTDASQSSVPMVRDSSTSA